MKKIAITSILILFIATTFAQGPAKDENIKSDYYGFQMSQIEHVLQLDEKRSKRFRALYKEYIKESHDTRLHERHVNIVEQMSKQTDEQIEQATLESFERTRASLEMKERYYKLFREILSPREVSLMYEIERRTRNRIIEEQSNRKAHASAQTPAQKRKPQQQHPIQPLDD